MTEPVATGYAAALAELETILGELERADVDVDVLADPGQARRRADRVLPRPHRQRPAAHRAGRRRPRRGSGQDLIPFSTMSATSSISTDVAVAAKRELAAAFRAAAYYGFNEGIDNHFSLALPGHDDLFLLNRYGPHWSEITEDDILTIDFEGRVVDGEGEWETSAFMIHRGCHQARPSARAVFHTHMPYATALSLTVGGFDSKLSQNAMLFHNRVANLAYGGLVDAAEEGCRFGEVIGDEITVVMLANHGVMVIGTDVADAWQKMYFFERACQVQVLAQSTGQPLIRVSDAIAEHTAAQWLKEAPKAADQFAAVQRVVDGTAARAVHA